MISKIFKLSILGVSLIALITVMVACGEIDETTYYEEGEIEENVNDLKVGLEEDDLDDSAEETDEECDDEEETPRLGATEVGRSGTIEPLKFTTGEFAGQYNPRDIRGSYTLADISYYFDIPLEHLAIAYNLPVDEAKTFQNKNYKYWFEGLIGDERELGNGSVAFFVSLYTGLPLELHEPTYLLEQGAELLKSLDKLTPEQLEYVTNHTITIEDAAPIPLDEFDPTEYEYDYEEEFVVDGSTTFGDLLDMGITKAQLENILGGEIPELDIRAKDYCVQENIPFSDDFKPYVMDILYSML